MLGTDVPRRNHLLAALPEDEYERLTPLLEPVQLPPGKILYESGCQLRHVYFPTTAIVSLLYVMEDGASAEIAGIGNEGMLGVALIMGGFSMPNRAMVLSAGTAYRLKSQAFMQQFNRAGGRRTGALQHVLLRYTQALITQMSQIAACNRHHSMEQQLCRWLLSCLDRSASNELTLTQELIASVLGVRREGITEAAGKLQQAGFIRYRRGHITVLDRTGLEDRACECYQTVKTEYDRLLPDVSAAQSVGKPRLRLSHAIPLSEQHHPIMHTIAACPS
ncbi:MAG TPA: Crp/Fnr family transcriptional regulator [Gammaproteobacteria bacterium]